MQDRQSVGYRVSRINGWGIRLTTPIASMLLTTALSFLTTPTVAQPSPSLRVVVNSSQDGAIQADGQLTLRKAISLLNGTLSIDRLSDAEKAQVTPSDTPRIDFNLPASDRTIRLTEELPPLAAIGLIVDGTTQPGYDASRSAIRELPLPMPVVAITPAEGKQIFRGLTVVADRVTIRGLRLYGFTFIPSVTVSTPPADIFIAHRLPPPDITKQTTPANFSPFYADDLPPKNVVIENNWLGSAPTHATSQSSPRSAFGVSVFNGVNTTIRRNWIANHDGSAIITSVRAENLLITENVITGNGVAGMPDAIRLEGNINQTQVTSNLICGNDGSGVYLFKPDGSVQIRDNQIIYNGRRLRRAAVYLMGSNHQVTGNQIRYQAGSGVVVAAYPRSLQNRIQSNQFTDLEGLSIDLVTNDNSDVYDYQQGDGANPPRNSENRRLDTGNAAINAPQFITGEFVAVSQVAALPSTQTPLLQPSAAQVAPVDVYGTADPGSQIDLYRVIEDGSGYGPLSQAIATVETDRQGKFHATLTNLRAGDSISAIATLPQYGTSEPARNARIRSIDPAAPVPTPKPASSTPQCVTPVAELPPASPPASTRLTIPARIHFALDRATILAASARVLDQIAQVLQENPAILVTIEGHTDPRANNAYNQELGMRRAIAARNYLLGKGIAPERMTIRSFGKQNRLTTGTSRLDYARDRRAEFRYQNARDIEVVIQDEDIQLEP